MVKEDVAQQGEQIGDLEERVDEHDEQIEDLDSRVWKNNSS